MVDVCKMTIDYDEYGDLTIIHHDQLCDEYSTSIPFNFYNFPLLITAFLSCWFSSYDVVPSDMRLLFRRQRLPLVAPRSHKERERGKEMGKRKSTTTVLPYAQAETYTTTSNMERSCGQLINNTCPVLPSASFKRLFLTIPVEPLFICQTKFQLWICSQDNIMIISLE